VSSGRILSDPRLLFPFPFLCVFLSFPHDIRRQITSVISVVSSNTSRQTPCSRVTWQSRSSRWSCDRKIHSCAVIQRGWTSAERWHGLHHIAKPIVKCDIAVCGNGGQPGQIFVVAYRAKEPRGLREQREPDIRRWSAEAYRTFSRHVIKSARIFDRPIDSLARSRGDWVVGCDGQ